ncbi:MAG: hypothetical protein KC583_09100 [Myxococcales bacterium]|nr:hypothetical protein [Myxococcales bacterium]
MPNIVTSPTPHGRARRSSRGLTLLELIIVVGVLVLMMGVGISSLGQISSAQLRTQTNRLAAAMRYTYSRAVANGLYMRMVIDIDADKYWVEASTEPVFIGAEKRQEGVDPNAPPEDADDKAEEGVPLPDRPSFSKDELVPEVTMERGIGIDGVLTSNQEDVFRSGKAYVHFFPNGQVEPTIIYTTDGDEAFNTLLVHPWTGRVERKAGKVDPGAEFGRPDDEEAEGR